MKNRLAGASAEAFAPATIGNVGPGFDVLGAAVEGLADRISVTLIQETSGQAGARVPDTVVVSGRNAADIPRDPEKNVAVIAARKMLALCGIESALRIDIHRALPLSGGMGGSAAAAVGAAVAASRALSDTGILDHKRERPTEVRQILEAALAGESLVAGRHLDNIAPCLFGGLSLVRSVEDFDIVQVPLADKWWVALATPDVRVETKYARSVLQPTSPQALWVKQMAHTAALVHGLHTGDSALVRRSLVDHYAEPARAPLIPGFAALRQAAFGAGSLGFSISGAGPTVFALCDSRAVAAACASAMASVGEGVSTHVGRFGGQGALI